MVERHPSKYLINKWVKSYHFLDFDGDGILTPNDYVKFVTNVEKIVKCHHAETEALMANCESWMKLLFPMSSSCVDLNAFINNCIKLYNDKEHHRKMNDVTASTLFSIIDLNNDGTISLAELSIFYHAAGMHDDELIQQIFHNLDKDKDGLIQRKEYVEEFVKYYTEDDESVGDVLLYGPL